MYSRPCAPAEFDKSKARQDVRLVGDGVRGLAYPDFSPLTPTTLNMATIPIVKKLPPAPPRKGLGFDEGRFSHAKQIRPVAARLVGGEIESTGLDFSDYAHCHTTVSTLAPQRRMETPTWANNDAQLRALVVAYMERRAGLHTAQPGTEKERLERAQARLLRDEPNRVAVLDRLCHELVRLRSQPQSAATAARMQFLVEQIESIDTALRINRNIAQVVLGVVHHYYRCGRNSVETAAAMRLKPPHVRRMLWALAQVAKHGISGKSQAGKGKRTTRRPRARRKAIPAAALIEARKMLLAGASHGQIEAAVRIPWEALAEPLAYAAKRRSLGSAAARVEIVSSEEFRAMFEKARCHLRATTCKRGHPICAENARVDYLRHKGGYRCDPCSRLVQLNYEKRHR